MNAYDARHISVIGGLLLIAVMGFVYLADYSGRPGAGVSQLTQIQVDEFADQMPQSAQGRPLLVVFYHPKCPCTFATARNLERLLPQLHVPPNILAYAFCPQDAPKNWIESRSTQAMRQLNGSRIIRDDDGSVCRRLDVSASGHILSFSQSGELLFSGGLTPFRGHEGDCRALSNLADCLNGKSGKLNQWPVFGCQILEPVEEK